MDDLTSPECCHGSGSRRSVVARVDIDADSARGEEVTGSGTFTNPGAKVKDMPRVSTKNQVTLPVDVMRAAGLRPGDEVTVRPVGEGEVIVAARGSRVRRHAGIAEGIYREGELERLRAEWER